MRAVRAFVSSSSTERDCDACSAPAKADPVCPENHCGRYSPRVSTSDEQGRPEPPLAADEIETLRGFLDYQRSTLAWKCGGLDSEGLGATVASSSMTLGGILKHMALVEDSWFSRYLFGREYPSPWDSVDWSEDPDWEWHSAAGDSPSQLFDLWRDSVERSRACVTDALSQGGLDRLAERKFADGRSPSLRWIMLHMVEEYRAPQRPCGHPPRVCGRRDGRVAFSSTKGKLATGSHGGGRVSRDSFGQQGEASVDTVAFGPDGGDVLTGQEDGRAMIWSTILTGPESALVGIADEWTTVGLTASEQTALRDASD